MISTLASWYKEQKPIRQTACKGKYGYERTPIIEMFQRDKRRAMKHLSVSNNNDMTMRSTYISISQNIWLARLMLSKPGLLLGKEREEKKKVIRRSIRQCRNMRLDYGLPKMFYAGKPFFVGPNNHVPTYSMDDAINAGVKFHGISYMMTGSEGKRVLDTLIRTRHAGLWSGDQLMLDNDERVVTPETKHQWVFWFENVSDMMLFKLKYQGQYEEA